MKMNNIEDEREWDCGMIFRFILIFIAVIIFALLIMKFNKYIISLILKWKQNYILYQ